MKSVVRVYICVSTVVLCFSCVVMNSAQAECYKLEPKDCGNAAETGYDCDIHDCDVEYVGGSGPGEPPVAIYTCQDSIVGRKTPNTSHKIAKPNADDGKDAITTGTNFVYCDEARPCKVGEFCSGGKCVADGAWAPYPDTSPTSRTYDVVFTANAQECFTIGGE